MAGGGIKPGVTYGCNRRLGLQGRWINHYRYTIFTPPYLHLLGIDHEELTYRFSGRDIRLTDVHGKITEDILL